jgi:hypothetical protein
MTDPIPSLFSQMCPPPGIDRLHEEIYRDRYNRERAIAITTDDGVSWPVDLGEAGA